MGQVLCQATTGFHSISEHEGTSSLQSRPRRKRPLETQVPGGTAKGLPAPLTGLLFSQPLTTPRGRVRATLVARRARWQTSATRPRGPNPLRPSPPRGYGMQGSLRRRLVRPRGNRRVDGGRVGERGAGELFAQPALGPRPRLVYRGDRRPVARSTPEHTPPGAPGSAALTEEVRGGERIGAGSELARAPTALVIVG